MRSNRIIVPKAKRSEVLQQLHQGYCGGVKMKNRARNALYWPSMNKDIEQHTKHCELCQKYQKSKPKEPMIISEVPSLPWEMVSADILTHEGLDYQVIVDHYSFYWTLAPLVKMTTKHIVGGMFESFQHFGMPRVLRTDNGPQYTSYEFEQIMKVHDIQHVTSGPYYARGNSLAERAVQEAKKILRKHQFGTTEFYTELMELRTSPGSVELAAPSERLLGRRLRTLLPVHNAILAPKTIDPERVQKLITEERRKQRAYYDGQTRERPDFVEGQEIRVRDRSSKAWIKGTAHSVQQKLCSLVKVLEDQNE
ncbi:uncharacterized protein K02A2.6-like [Galendromus occidentalis]|uniref:RNA-directed DNA polymerase n=1 Tax=Galendromus occidentalis TaxID=34638 RepID=A0AAJ7P9B9_9ACAR|nr:uncharacterized protein K02A2.6-like [Galendromus occidentalis]